MNRSYQVTAASQMFIVKDLIRRLFIVWGVLFAIGQEWFWQGTNILINAEIAAGLFLVAEVIPSALYHLHYYRHDRHKVIHIESDSGTMTVAQNGSSDTFKLSELERVEVILDPFLYKGRKRGQASWDSYHYSRLHTKDGKMYIITCLLVNDLRKFFGDLGVEITRVKRMYPIIRSK